MAPIDRAHRNALWAHKRLWPNLKLGPPRADLDIKIMEQIVPNFRQLSLLRVLCAGADIWRGDRPTWALPINS
jgi:hypothetical protein